MTVKYTTPKPRVLPNKFSDLRMLNITDGPYRGLTGYLKRPFRSSTEGRAYAYLTLRQPPPGVPGVVLVRQEEIAWA